jgi:hypothetical protein
MKTKALFLGLLIAAATALSYTAITDSNGEQAVDKTKIKIIPNT